jgi:hypothetical protein
VAQGCDEPVGEVAAESLLQPNQRRLSRLVILPSEGIDVREESGGLGRCGIREHGGTHATSIGVAIPNADP